MEKLLQEDTSKITDQSKLDKIKRTEATIESKRNELSTSEIEFQYLSSLPEYQEIEHYKQELDEFTSFIGLDSLSQSLSTVQKKKGGQKSQRGLSFEDKATAVIKNDLIELMKKRYSSSLTDFKEENLVIVRNITFGIASVIGSPGEFDILICLRTTPYVTLKKSSPPISSNYFNCKVLAVIEVKRNPDDIGTAYSGLQTAISWLCRNTSAYNPSDWANKNFPSGHFDKPFFHQSDSLVFTSESFDLISSQMISLSNGFSYVHDVFFVTKYGPFDNISSKDFNLIAHHLTSDIEFDDNLNDDNTLENLRQTILLSHPNEHSTSDVIDLLQQLQLKDQIIIIGKEEE